MALVLPARRQLSFYVAGAAALLSAITLSSLPSDGQAGDDSGVPEEAYDRLAADGSVELILSVNNSDVLAQVSTLLRTRGRGVAVDRLEELLSERLARAVSALPQGVVAAERFDQVGSLVVTVTSSQALDALNDLPNVVRVDLSQEMIIQLEQSLALIHQPDAVVAGHTGEGTSIAVLDTGVDYTREAFGFCTAPGVPAGCRVAFAEDFTFLDDGRLDGGKPKHGTNVAGIAAGVAPAADILALDVFGDSVASDASIINAISWVIDNAEAYNIKAVNLSVATSSEFGPEGSFFFDCPTGLKSSFQALLAAGIVPVVAAGNGGRTSRIAYPGCISEAYTVGATYDASGVNGAFTECTDNPTVVDTVACFSNSHGQMLDSLAPGARITAAGLKNWAGTSMAVPHVAAAAAVLGAIPGVSVEDAQSILRQTGPAITDTRNGVTKHRLDLEQAVAATEVQYVAPTSARTADLDHDGRIDRIRVVFAENLNDDLDDLSVAVEGYTVQGVLTGTAGDGVVLIDLNESSQSDSSMTPLVTLVDNQSLQTTSGAVAGPPGTSLSAEDGAGPAIVSGQALDRRRVRIDFSEPIDEATLLKSDLRLVMGGTNRSLKSLIKIDDDTWELFATKAARWPAGASGTVRFMASAVVNDSSGNGNTQTATVAVSAASN
jgi:subtilisin family serine protease